LAEAIPLATVTKQILIAGESTKETVKTIARGMPGVSGVTVVTNARVTSTTRAAAGASGARHSLRPLIKRVRKFSAKLGHIMPRDREAVFERPCLKNAVPRALPAVAGTTC
jgi:hypothetical protein